MEDFVGQKPKYNRIKYLIIFFFFHLQCELKKSLFRGIDVLKSDFEACVQRASAGFEAKYCALFQKDLILSFTRTVTEVKPPVVGYILRLL